MKFMLIPASILAFISVTALAADAQQATVSNTWFRALPSGLPAGGYFNLTNHGSAPLTLIGASSPACGMLMLHRSESENGVSRMMDVPRVDIAPNQTMHFATGGYHLMCMKPTAAMKPGATVDVTLQFEKGPNITAPFEVRNAQGMPQMH